MDDLWPVAAHEAGHAAAGVLLHATRNAGPVTIVATARADGRCFAGIPEQPTMQERVACAGRPYVLLPARLKHWYEVAVIMDLAGYAAEANHTGSDYAPEIASAAAPGAAGGAAGAARTGAGDAWSAAMTGRRNWRAVLAAEDREATRHKAVAEGQLPG